MQSDCNSCHSFFVPLQLSLLPCSFEKTLAYSLGEIQCKRQFLLGEVVWLWPRRYEGQTRLLDL